MSVTDWDDATVANNSHMVTHDKKRAMRQHRDVAGFICLVKRQQRKAILVRASQKSTVHRVDMDENS